MAVSEISQRFTLVMEQPSVLLHKRNPKFLRSLKDRSVVLAAHGTGDVLDTTSRRAIDVVDKREERIAADSHTSQFVQPFFPLLFCEGLRYFLEVPLVVLLFEFGLRRDLVGAEHVDSIGLLGSLDTFGELEGEGAGMEAHPPVVCTR
jgi:hypothetical protein